MTTVDQRPYLFLDVDGVIIPLRERRPKPPPGVRVEYPFLHRIEVHYGQSLSALGCDLVWATAWLEDANDEIAPRLGLPRLPVLAWTEGLDAPDDRLHWKTRDILAWAGDRPFVWLDDEAGDVDREWLAAHHSAPTLVHQVDGEAGLTESDLATVRHWLSRLAGQPPHEDSFPPAGHTGPRRPHGPETVRPEWGQPGSRGVGRAGAG